MEPYIEIHKGGKKFWFDRPNNNYDIVEIAHALSNICRYGGHGRHFYSVAQHSYYTSLIVPQEYALDALLHDAHEAFVGDVPTPLKILLPDYQAIEERYHKELLEYYGRPYPMPPEVKAADLQMLVTEKAHLLPNCTDDWGLSDIVPADIKIRFMPMRTAAEVFIRRYGELVK